MCQPRTNYFSSSVFNYYGKTWVGVGGVGYLWKMWILSSFCYWRCLHYHNLPPIIGSFNLVADPPSTRNPESTPEISLVLFLKRFSLHDDCLKSVNFGSTREKFRILFVLTRFVTKDMNIRH